MSEDRQTERAARDRALFDGIADRYARKDTLPASRRARRHRLLATVAGLDLDPEAQVLEVGCGAGFAAGYLHGSYGSYLGIDPSAELVRRARERCSAAESAFEGATFEVADLFAFEPAGRFDLVLMVGVLHHLEDHAAAVERCAVLLAPGGWLAVNEPQARNPAIQLARCLRARLDPGYSAEQDQLLPATVAELFRRAGLVEVEVRPQGLLSTPFAEVPLSPQMLTAPLSRLACSIDGALERRLPRLLEPLAWNVVVRGRKPGA